MAISPEVQAMLDKAKALTSKKAKDLLSFGLKEKIQEEHDAYIKLPWRSKAFFVLVPESFEWSSTIRNYYPEECVGGEGILLGDTVIIHGHPVGKSCFARDQCHVLGYKPKGDEGSVFLNNWRKFGYEA